MKIVILTGKSASGKDTLQNYLAEVYGFRRMMSSTDRPMRPGETDGKEYNFRTKSEFSRLIEENKLIESREYGTIVNGVPDTWRYGLEKIDDMDETVNYVAVLDLSGAQKVKALYPKETTVFYLYAPDEIREERCKQRGDFDVTEWERRLAKDEDDFSAEKRNTIPAFFISSTQNLAHCTEKIFQRIGFPVKSLDMDGVMHLLQESSVSYGYTPGGTVEVKQPSYIISQTELVRLLNFTADYGKQTQKFLWTDNCQ